MDFAKKILNKYGWKEGDGLGKNNTGIVKPLKANFKFDNAGLGADQASDDFNNRWWERVYNEATQNVEVKQDDGILRMNAKDDSVEISTKGYSLKKLKKAKKLSAAAGAADDHLYGNFLQTATLTRAGDEVENQNKVDLTDISVTKFKVLTDEEIFKACKGRTAHKGARHGLKLSGKLARLEQQEQILLEKILQKDYSKKEDSLEDGDKLIKKSKKKKKDKSGNEEELTGPAYKKIKKKKSKKDKIDNEEVHEQTEPKKRKKDKRAGTESQDVELCTLKAVEEIPKKKKRKLEKTDIDESCTLEEVIEVPKKKKKRKKNYSENE